MLIREFTESPGVELETIDLLDDLQVFMNNDPAFYRKVYYPVLSKFKKQIKSNGTCSEDIFRPCVDRAAQLYCQQFKISGNEKSVFTDVDRDELARKIFGQELKNIEEGIYDDKPI